MRAITHTHYNGRNTMRYKTAIDIMKSQRTGSVGRRAQREGLCHPQRTGRGRAPQAHVRADDAHRCSVASAQKPLGVTCS